MEKIKSPSMSFKGTVPSIYKSALISAGGVALAIVIFYIIKFLFPKQDFSLLETSIVTALSAWVINLIKVFVEQK